MIEKQPTQYDLVIIDIGMPSLTGAQLSQKMMEIQPGIPIILCTGHSDSANRETALAMGIKEIIEKPLAMSELVRIAREVLD